MPEGTGAPSPAGNPGIWQPLQNTGPDLTSTEIMGLWRQLICGMMVVITGGVAK